MPLYESTFIAKQDLSRQDITKLVDQFSGIVTNGGGKIVKTEYWGLRNLAYRINKNRKGHYAMIAVDAPYDSVKEMERNMSINEDVMRSLIIRVDAIEEGPSAIMNSRSSRDDNAEGEGLGEDVSAA